MNELTPEVNEALRQLHEHSKAVMEALADLARQGCYEFKQHPGGEYIDRDEAMRNVIRLRDAHTRMSHHARAALVAAGRIAGVAAVAPSDEAEFCIEGAGGMFLASSQGPRAEAWREIQHYAAQYHDGGLHPSIAERQWSSGCSMRRGASAQCRRRMNCAPGPSSWEPRLMVSPPLA
jgi:hypothetical protein